MRGDLDLCVVRFSRDWYYEPPHEWLIMGMPSVYRGHAGLRQWAADLHEAWFEDGLIARERDFADWDEALRLVGVR